MNQTAVKTFRDSSIDFIKVVAIIGVVFIHTCTGGYTYKVGSPNWVESVFLGSLTRASVPLFLMCSGAVMLDPGKDLSIKKLYKRYILRILLALFFWAAAYKLFNLIVNNTFSFDNLIQAFKEVILFKHETHFYYLHIILLVYIFLPITRFFVKYADKRFLEYALILWLILGIVYPTFKPYWPFTLLSGIPLQWLLNMAYASIGYGLLGYYIKKYPLNKKIIYTLSGLAGFAVIFVGTWVISAKQNELYQNFFEGMTLGTAFLAAGIFGTCTVLFSKSKSAKLNSLVVYGSKSSFCIYLVHVFFVYIFQSVGFTVKILPCIISIPLIVIANILCSVCMYLFLSHIPLVNKWLI